MQALTIQNYQATNPINTVHPSLQHVFLLSPGMLHHVMSPIYIYIVWLDLVGLSRHHFHVPC